MKKNQVPGYPEDGLKGTNTPPEEPEYTENYETIDEPIPDLDSDPSRLATPVQGEAYTSETSVLAATPEEHRKARVRGKPPGGHNPPLQPTHILPPDKPVRIPTPPVTLFKSDSVSKNHATRVFYTYWNNLPTWAKANITCYVYRDHPVLLDPPIDPETGKPKWWKYIDKISGSEPVQDDMDFLHRYGCGTYLLRFNELITRGGKDRRTLCEVYIMNVGGGDYKSNPPHDQRIDAIEENLDLNHPSNKAYVGFLRGQGRLPEQIDETRKTEDMATATVVEKVLEQNSTLVRDALSSARNEGNKDKTPICLLYTSDAADE